MTVKNVKGQKRVWKFKYEQIKQEAEAVMACHSVDLEEDEDEDGYRDRAGDERMRG
ncbi:GM18481 [Drosophila sechellia]|uniref:GM18481 n=1 Tax=Drosophila sechellia TaxID=7238 RepID=B4I3A8_DROSE|nr:GM18481 [Drosophila sechellia]